MLQHVTALLNKIVKWCLARDLVLLLNSRHGLLGSGGGGGGGGTFSSLFG